MKKVLLNKNGLRAVGAVLFVCLLSFSSFGQAIGDYGSVATGNWSAFATTWVKCVTAGTWTGATAATVVPTAADNVWIRSPYTVTANGSGSAYICKNLTVESGATLTGQGTLIAPSYLRINGTLVQIDGALVDDKVSLDFYTASKTTIASANATALRFGRLRANVSTGFELEINANVNVSYAGSSAASTGAGLTPNNLAMTLTILANKTVQTANGSFIAAGTSGSTDGAGSNYTINIYGTLITGGLALGGSTTGTNLNLRNIATKTTTLNIFNGGTVTVNGQINAQAVSLAAAMNIKIESTGTTPALTATGAIDVTGATLEYSGTSAMNSNTSLLSVKNLTINNSGGVVLGTGTTVTATSPLSAALTLTLGTLTTGSNTLTIGGNVSVARTSGSIDVSSGTVAFTNTSALTLPASTFTGSVNNLTLNGAGGVTLGSATTVNGALTLTSGTVIAGANTLTLAGTVTRTSGNIDASNAAATVAFTNTSALTLPASVFSGSVNNLTLNGAGGVTLGSSTTVNSALTLTSGTLTVGANTLTLGGTVIGASSIDASNAAATVAFTNASALALPATVFSGAVNNMTLNGAGGVTLAAATTVTNTLTLTTGNLILGTSNLTVGSFAGSPSTTSHVYTNSTGILQSDISAGATEIFPIGATAGSYDPVSINPTSAATFSALVKVTTVKEDFTPEITDFNKVAPRQWNVTPTVGTPGSTVLILTNGGASYTPTTPKLGHYNGTVWEELTATYGSNAWTATTTSFSPFGGGSSGGFSAVLSVELSNFKAKSSNNTNLLTWTTATEKNNMQFNIERSTNGVNFTSIGTVKGSGTTTKANNYTFTDETPLSISYYRLQSVDFDGKAQASNIVSVFRSTSGKLKVYPTVVSDKLTIVVDNNEAQTFGIYDLMGKTIQTGQLNGQKELSISTLATGTYVLKVGSEVVKFVKN